MVGVLSAENALLQKKLSSALKKGGRSSAQTRAMDAEEQRFLLKREENPNDEITAKEINKQRSKFILVAKKGGDSQKVTIQECPVDTSRSAEEEIGQEKSEWSRSLHSARDLMKNPRPPFELRKGGFVSTDCDFTEEGSQGSQIKKPITESRIEGTGVVTPLMGTGLKKTFVRSNNNMLPILEDQRESCRPSPLNSQSRDGLYSPKRQLNIEQLRLGFSSDSKCVFPSRREESNKPTGSLLNGKEESNPSQPSLGFPGTSRVFCSLYRF